MKLERTFVIKNCQTTGLDKVHYLLWVISDKEYGFYKNRLYLDGALMEKYGLSSTRDLVGKELILTLTSKKIENKEDMFDLSKEDFRIHKVEKVENIFWNYGIPFSEKRSGLEHLVSLISPLYGLDIKITDEEYKKIKNLPPETLFESDLKLK